MPKFFYCLLLSAMTGVVEKHDIITIGVAQMLLKAIDNCLTSCVFIGNYPRYIYGFYEVPIASFSPLPEIRFYSFNVVNATF